MIRIAIAGNPNSGKTTLFNELTGTYQHVGNWPGVTVEKKEGTLKKHKDFQIIDLPGIYSLSPYTLEEVVARNFLVDERPDVIINVVDASNLERNLFLTTQLLELNIPVIVALNMMDIVRKRNDEINIRKLSKQLDCVVVETIAKSGQGMKTLVSALVNHDAHISKLNVYESRINKVTFQIETMINRFQPTLKFDAIKIFERDELAIERLKLSEERKQSIDKLISEVEKEYEDDSVSISISKRYDKIEAIIKESSRKNTVTETISDKIDSVLTSRWLGLPIFFLIMGLIYYLAITTLGDYGIQTIESLTLFIQDHVTNFLIYINTSEWVRALVVDGIIGSIGAIFVFVPQLMILFFLLSILEDTGYMSRIAFLMDRVFKKLGLSGRSFIPMLIGTGCTIPGIMAARTIEKENDRKLTILLTPFVPCGAKIPIFAMFISMLFSDKAWMGAMVYLVSFVVIIITGIVMKRTKMFKGEPSPFIMELPEYKLPSAKGLFIHMWDKAKEFIIKAGSVIFVSVLIIWLLQSFSWNFEYLESTRINESILASIGNVVRWIFIPLGFGDSWVPATAAMTGMVAKEVVVSTLITVGEVIPVYFSQLTAISFMIFLIFSAPCFAAIAAMKRELGSTKMMLFAIGFQTGLAYVLSFFVYQGGQLVLQNTEWIVQKPLQISLAQQASETTVLGNNVVLYVFGVMLLGMFVIIFINWLQNRQHQVLIESESHS